MSTSSPSGPTAASESRTPPDTTGAAGGLAKTYNPAETEPRVTASWDRAGAFHPDPMRVLEAAGKPYCILIPPPNVTAALHLGHALNNTLQDVLVRAHRMMGYETLWMPGTDHAGIATQAVVEKRLRKEGKLKGALKTSMARDEFVGHVQAFKDEYEATITAQLKAMGCSCDWDRQRFTMDEQCAAAVREAFFRLFKDGLIYRGKRLVNWDPALQTAVADDECYDEEIDAHFYYLRYPLVHRWGAETLHERAGGEFPPDDPVPVTWSELAARGYPGASQHPAEEPAWVTVATTRPETYLGDTAVAVNPRDPRAKALRHLSIELPLVGRIIPIVEDDYVVMPRGSDEATERRSDEGEGEREDPKAKYATGFLKVTPAHDQNDYELYHRHKAAVDGNSVRMGLINVMAPDATISDKHGWSDVGDAHIFVGKKRDEARKLAVKEFEARGLLEGIKPYRHSVKHSDRSKAIVEPYLSDQWYVRVTDERMAVSANRALVPDQRSPGGHAGGEGAATTDGQLRFYPPRYAKTYEQWHEGIRDWCISRQLWWGHRIPVWRSGPVLTGPTDIYTKLREWERAGRIACHNELDAFKVAQTMQSPHPNPDRAESLDHLSYAESQQPATRFVCVRDPNDSEVISSIEDSGLVQDPDVLDTWFSSALWPLSTLGWPDPAKFNATSNKGMLEAFNPSSVLCTAREIITLWVSRMVMFNRYFLPEATERRSDEATNGGEGRGPVPFRDVFIHAMIQDGEGRKMSKSLGNGVDPLDIIESHGSDAMRFTLVGMTTNTQDVRMPVKKDSRTGKNSSEKFDNGRNYCNKLWNTARFVLEKLGRSDGATPPQRRSDGGGIQKTEMSLLDRWMMSRVATTVKAVDSAITKYEFSDYADALYKVLWWDLCDWYLEGVKPTVESNPVQRAVLAHALETIVRLLHPIAPFITEAIWEQVKELETAPISGVTLDPSRKAGLLCTAGWPRIDEKWIDGAAEREFEEVRELVTAIRNVRSEHQVAPKRKITLHATAAAQRLMGRAPGLVETLCGIDRVESGKAAAGGVAFRAGGEELFLSNLADAGSVDAGAEKDRLSKQLETLKKTEATIAGRLGNPGYVERAPAKLVEESKAQLAKTREEIAAIEAKLKGMG
jgi:valyl-tRNA synthetase